MMTPVRKIEEVIGLVLLLGTLLSALFVLIGGMLFLFQHGNENLHTAILTAALKPNNIFQIWKYAFSFSALGIIELGLLLLVMTQVVRVALITGFYIWIRDYWFILISGFILLVLIISFFH